MGAATADTAMHLGWAVVESYRLLSEVEVFLAVGVPIIAATALAWIWWRKGSIRTGNVLVYSTMVLALAGTTAGQVLFYLTGQAWF